MQRIAGWLLVTVSMSVASTHAAELANGPAAPAPAKKPAAEDTEGLPEKKEGPALEEKSRVADESVKNEVDRRERVRNERTAGTRERAFREPSGRF